MMNQEIPHSKSVGEDAFMWLKGPCKFCVNGPRPRMENYQLSISAVGGVATPADAARYLGQRVGCVFSSQIPLNEHAIVKVKPPPLTPGRLETMRMKSKFGG